MRYHIIILYIFFLISCTVNIPDIEITGEKTALENQIMGKYQNLEEDAWLVSCERGDNNFIIIPQDQEKVVNAVRTRLYYKDDLNQFRLEKIVGEGRDGLLVLLDTSSPTNKDIIDTLFYHENKSRNTIIEAIRNSDPEFMNKMDSEIRISFFKMILNEAPKGTMYQDKSYNWKEK